MFGNISVKFDVTVTCLFFPNMGLLHLKLLDSLCYYTESIYFIFIFFRSPKDLAREKLKLVTRKLNYFRTSC